MPGFLKRYDTAASASEALRRSRILCAQAIKTPQAAPTQDPCVLEFEQVHGLTGPALIGKDLSPLLDTLATLHASRMSGLPVYDPLLRIRSRLTAQDHTDLQPWLSGPMPSGTAVIHADLHVGQFIQSPERTVWIVDLDDLAIGPAEADLGNFAAHLATTDPQTGIAAWADRIAALWQGAGRAMDPDLYQRCVGLSLLRRYLKLRAAGRPDFRTEIFSYLRDKDSFSIR